MFTTNFINAEARPGDDRTCRQRPRVWSVGLVAGAVAAIATSLGVVLARGFGAHVAVGGEQIPAPAFAMFTLVGALLGIGLAKLSQRAHRPRTVFLGVTMGLTGVSIVPDLVADATWVSRSVLIAAHLIAAAVIVPSIAQRLQP